MPARKQAKTKREGIEGEEIVDSFELWLKKQRPRPVRAKSGFIADAEIGDDEGPS